MSRRQIYLLMAVILIVALATYAYLHNRADPVQDAAQRSAFIVAPSATMAG